MTEISFESGSSQKHPSHQGQNCLGEANSLQFLPLAQIKANPVSLRRVWQPQSLQALAQAIAAHGVLQPLLVRTIPHGYELVYGERRWRAAQMAGLQQVPVLLCQVSRTQSRWLSLAENQHQQPLSPIETTWAIINHLADELGYSPSQAQGFLKQQYSQLQLGKPPSLENIEPLLNLVGISFSTFVTKYLPLTELPPPLAEALEMGLSKSKALLLAKLPPNEWRTLLPIANSLSVRALKQRTQPSNPARYQRLAQRLSSERCWNKLSPQQKEHAVGLIESLEKLFMDSPPACDRG